MNKSVRLDKTAIEYSFPKNYVDLTKLVNIDLICVPEFVKLTPALT